MATPGRGRNFLPALEVTRGVAALLVLIFHAGVKLQDGKYFAFGPLPWVDPLYLGTRGVDIFFVLSGFIIFRAHRADIGRPDRLGVYGLRRVLRIYPVYWAVLLPLLLAFFVHPEWGSDYLRQPWHVMQSVLLLPDAKPPAVNDAWTLRHELLFYLLFASLLVGRRLGAALLAAWLAGIVLHALLGGGGWVMDFLFAPFNIQFFFGMAAAGLSERALPTRPFLLAGLAGFVALVAIEPHATLDAWPRVLGYGLASALLMLGLSGIREAASLPRAALYLGRISYPLYIVQPLAIPAGALLLVRLGGPHWPPLAAMAALMAACLAAAALFHLAVEIPSQRFSRRITSGPKPPPAAVPL